MGKRYYCDYCDRSFLDGAENRKKHINGVQHQKMRKVHYDLFRSANDILQEEMAKNACKRFKNTGNCDFGASCMYSHLTSDDIYYLQEQARNDKMKNDLKDVTFPNVEESWLNAWLKKVETTEKNSQPRANKLPLEYEISSWSPPSSLSTYYHLPPSLIPPKIDDFNSLHLATWQ